MLYIIIVFTSKYKQDLYNYLSITIGDTVVDCSSQVKDKGATSEAGKSLFRDASVWWRCAQYFVIASCG